MKILIKYGVNDESGNLSGKYYTEFAGNSSETKPTEMIADGSIFLETDSGNLFGFDEADQTWRFRKNVRESAGGGGGGGGAEDFLVTLTPTALDYSGTMDKTAEEITAAIEAGKHIVLSIEGSSIGFSEILLQAGWYSKASGSNNYCVSATILMLPNTQITIVTGDSTGSTGYSTYMYSLDAIE